MLNAEIVHNEVYELLNKHSQIKPSFYFTFRKSNRDGKLDKGYWFYGNDYYLAVSFWSGMDWKNKTPNIIFVILFESGETYLEINTSDSDAKRQFINTYLLDELELKINGKRHRKDYGKNYINALESFIKNDKVKIDKIISKNATSFFGDKNSGINFINELEFAEQKEKVDNYRRISNKSLISVKSNQKPVKVNNIIIKKYGPIDNINIENIPINSQWIFFTGENGTGKTSILRAIASAICSKKPEIENSDAEISLKLFYNSNDLSTYNYSLNKNSNTNEFNTVPLTSGFAAYGPSRLKTKNSGLSSKDLDSISTDDLTSSLFDDTTFLIDLQYQFNIWNRENSNKLKNLYNKRKYFITEILTDILPNLYDINFNDQIGDIPVTSYIEKDNEGAEFRKVTFDRLASGLKSMIAMIGDILIRLYIQQPEITDPAEFTGIILIDEIDIHLHPKLQKQIVQQLTRTFPKIQFIVSTHSPIPFLGAPKNSQIFSVERMLEKGVEIKRLDELLELGDLLPNTILTSPIFGLDDIIPESHDQKKFVRTELTYSDLIINNKIKEKISSFLTDEKEQELINLFKARRE